MNQENSAAQIYRFYDDKIRMEGYFGVIDGRAIAITPREFSVFEVGTGLMYRKMTKEAEVLIGKKGKENFSSVQIDYDNMEHTGKDYFENLTPLEIHNLAVAKVIKLNKAQGEIYNKWLNEVLYKKAEDE